MRDIPENSSFFMFSSSFTSLFPPEICRNFPPLLRFPLQGRGIGVLAQPLLGALYQPEERFALGVARQLGLALLLPHPGYGVAAVAVHGHVQPLLLQQGQGVHDGQEFADVVRAIHGPQVKHLLSGGQVHAPVFHLPRVAAARRVHHQATRVHGLGQGDFGNLRRLPLRGAGRAAAYVLVRRCGKGTLRLRACVKRLELRPLVALRLQLAVRPLVVDARADACPDHVVFLFLHFLLKGLAINPSFHL